MRRRVVNARLNAPAMQLLPHGLSCRGIRFPQNDGEDVIGDEPCVRSERHDDFLQLAQLFDIPGPDARPLFEVRPETLQLDQRE